MLRIKNVSYLKDYKLQLLFSDGKSKVVDFENWLDSDSEYLLPLKELKYFKKVKMDAFNYTISWPNGADFCPDVLYEIGFETPEKLKSTPSLAKLHKQNSVSRLPTKAKKTTRTNKI